jgi:hypothetical protein
MVQTAGAAQLAAASEDVEEDAGALLAVAALEEDSFDEELFGAESFEPEPAGSLDEAPEGTLDEEPESRESVR